MKLVTIIAIIMMTIGCDTENAVDCLQRTGQKVSKEIIVGDFKRILVNPNIELVLKQGIEPLVLIETGSNLLNEIDAKIEGDRLILSNTNDCNLVRAFKQTKITVTAVDVTEIRSATQFDIRSEGVLSFPELTLLSEDFFDDSGGNTTGQFILNLKNDNTIITTNNLSSFFIKGETKNFEINVSSGLGRVETPNFIAEKVSVFHRGSNKIIVNPRESIKGSILSTGDVIALNRPDFIDVSTSFIGKLIFK